MDAKEPEFIYLEPKADDGYGTEGRLWCEDDVWTVEDGGPGVKFIRYDLHTTALLEAEKAALERAEKVAEIHLHTTADGDGEIWIVKRILQDIRALPSTPAKDQEG